MYLSLLILTECQKTTQGHSHPAHRVTKILKVTQATQCLRTFKTANPTVSPLSLNTNFNHEWLFKKCDNLPEVFP